MSDIYYNFLKEIITFINETIDKFDEEKNYNYMDLKKNIQVFFKEKYNSIEINLNEAEKTQILGRYINIHLTINKSHRDNKNDYSYLKHQINLIS